MTEHRLTPHKRECLTRWMDGELLETLHPDGKWLVWELPEAPAMHGPDDNFRIVAPQNLRPWTVDEVPVGWQIRRKGARGAANRGIILGAYEGGTCFKTELGSISIHGATITHECAPPGPANEVAWQPCGVSE